MTDPRRRLPSVGRLLEAPELGELRAIHPHGLLRDAARAVIAEARASGTPPAAGWTAAVSAHLADRVPQALVPVLNATGVVLHTNLGRAPLAPAAVEAIRTAALGPVPLELDLPANARAHRGEATEALLGSLTGAEAALVVNNAAAALVLAMQALAGGREVVVSRGELVEIGGQFRIPEILAAAGVRLREVGTTNRTRLADYSDAVGPETGAFLVVHRANFTMTGYTDSPAPAAVARAARAAGVPCVHDVGSGLLHDLSGFGLREEPLVPEAVAAGADVVLFSGDKLVGGPQAGCLVGRRVAIAACRRHPLARVLRADKLALAGLEATLHLHASRERALAEVPVLAMLTLPEEAIAERARRVAERLPDALAARVVPGESAIGGGSFAGASLRTALVALEGTRPDPGAAARVLRTGTPAVLPRVHDGRVVLDLRTVRPSDDDALVGACRAMVP